MIDVPVTSTCSRLAMDSYLLLLVFGMTLLTLPTGMAFSAVELHNSQEPATPVIFSNQWAVHVSGGESQARELAATNGFEFVSKVSRLYAPVIFLI